VGTATTGSGGIATLSGVSLAGLTAGTAAGAIGVRFAGDASDAPTSASGDLVVVPAPVTVLGAQWQTRHLTKKKTSKVLVIGFSGALDPVAARMLADFQLATVVKAKKGRAQKGKPVKLISATYDPSAHTVTLTPKGKLPAAPLQLTIIAGK